MNISFYSNYSPTDSFSSDLDGSFISRNSSNDITPASPFKSIQRIVDQADDLYYHANYSNRFNDFQSAQRLYDDALSLIDLFYHYDYKTHKYTFLQDATEIEEGKTLILRLFVKSDVNRITCMIKMLEIPKSNSQAAWEIILNRCSVLLCGIPNTENDHYYQKFILRVTYFKVYILNKIKDPLVYQEVEILSDLVDRLRELKLVAEKHLSNYFMIISEIRKSKEKKQSMSSLFSEVEIQNTLQRASTYLSTGNFDEASNIIETEISTLSIRDSTQSSNLLLLSILQSSKAIVLFRSKNPNYLNEVINLCHTSIEYFSKYLVEMNDIKFQYDSFTTLLYLLTTLQLQYEVFENKNEFALAITSCDRIISNVNSFFTSNTLITKDSQRFFSFQASAMKQKGYLLMKIETLSLDVLKQIDDLWMNALVIRKKKSDEYITYQKEAIDLHMHLANAWEKFAKISPYSLRNINLMESQKFACNEATKHWKFLSELKIFDDSFDEFANNNSKVTCSYHAGLCCIHLDTQQSENYFRYAKEISEDLSRLYYKREESQRNEDLRNELYLLLCDVTFHLAFCYYRLRKLVEAEYELNQSLNHLDEMKMVNKLLFTDELYRDMRFRYIQIYSLQTIIFDRLGNMKQSMRCIEILEEMNDCQDEDSQNDITIEVSRLRTLLSKPSRNRDLVSNESIDDDLYFQVEQIAVKDTIFNEILRPFDIVKSISINRSFIFNRFATLVMSLVLLTLVIIFTFLFGVLLMFVSNPLWLLYLYY